MSECVHYVLHRVYRKVLQLSSTHSSRYEAFLSRYHNSQVWLAARHSPSSPSISLPLLPLPPSPSRTSLLATRTSATSTTWRQWGRRRGEKKNLLEMRNTCIYSIECHGFKSHPRQFIFLRKSDYLGCAVSLFLVCVFDLLSSFSSLIKTSIVIRMFFVWAMVGWVTFPFFFLFS